MQIAMTIISIKLMQNTYALAACSHTMCGPESIKTFHAQLS